MTTTLRPEGPETPTAAGGRTRRWRILTNGRQIGSLRTTAVPVGGQLWGEIAELEITEGRGRGRGTFGALAAEEVLRGWGCTRVDVRIPDSAPTARALAGALGYTERSLALAKRLTTAPALPAGVSARPFEEDGLRAWLDRSSADYARALVRSGLTEEQTRARVGCDQRLLPEGADTPGNALASLYGPDGGPQPYGSIWVDLHLTDLPDGEPLAWVMVVEVSPAHRGRGHGRTLMLLAERACLAAGVRNLGLNVFADNEVAIGLYASLGYGITNRLYGKQL
ncbi:hypothetical protein VM98_02985 [Streptomyces rubellomurinus subsp. indigoferus]|nr:hypothetical protein VM98_02985 [Streptomyces rubellomurinus subsp. indigoferus]